MRGITKRTQLAYVAALFTFVVGIFGTFFPLQMMTLVGLTIEAPRGISSIRAIYGLPFIGAAVSMVWGLTTRPEGKPWLVAASFFWLVIAAGRILSMLLLDFAITPFNAMLVGIELAAGLSALFAGFETPKDSPSEVDREDEEEYVSRTL